MYKLAKHKLHISTGFDNIMSFNAMEGQLNGRKEKQKLCTHLHTCTQGV